MYADESSTTGSGGADARFVLFHELCPALHAIMEDGLKPEVITQADLMIQLLMNNIKLLCY